MTRKDFFKKLGIGAAACVVAPKILAEKKPEKSVKEITDEEKRRFREIYHQIKKLEEPREIVIRLEGKLRGEDICYSTRWNNPFWKPI